MTTENLAILNYLLIIFAINTVGFLYFYFSPARRTVELKLAVNSFMTFFALVTVAFLVFASRTFINQGLSLTLANGLFLSSAYAVKNGFMYRTGRSTKLLRRNKWMWTHIGLLTLINSGVFYLYTDNFAVRASITQISVAWVFYSCLATVAKNPDKLSEGERIAQVALSATVFFIIFSTILHWFDQSFFTYMSSLMFTQAIAVTALMGAFLTLMMSDLIEDHYINSVTDPLTGVYNRRFFIEQAPKVISLNRSKHSQHSIIVVDIDNFKKFNDNYGHATGDAVLKSFAELLSSHIRGSDVVARFGGEEFAVLLPNSSVEVASVLADRLCSAVATTPVIIDGKEYQVTASFGVTSVSGPHDLSRCLEIADKAMYQAKKAGKNRVVVLEMAS